MTRLGTLRLRMARTRGRAFLPAGLRGFQRRAEEGTLLIREAFHPLLHNHSVEPAYPNWRSINITGDYRALYEVLKEGSVVFMKIGTHADLYG